jgi:hypothetical protein
MSQKPSATNVPSLEETITAFERDCKLVINDLGSMTDRMKALLQHSDLTPAHGLRIITGLVTVMNGLTAMETKLREAFPQS